MLQISKNQSGSEVQVRRGEAFEIHLPENPTTGYRWHLRSSGSPVLDVQDDSFEASGALCGGGGVRSWRFLPVQEGAKNLEMEYRRSWEKQAAETFTVTVRVSS
jgi:inhibitor of cysteine peptidase